jgi:glycosyltransferase involved in cell wall biosynthesis
MIRLLFLIRSLEAGGAERQLVELIRAMDKSQFDMTVATFYGGGAFRHELESLKAVRVLSLDKKGRWDVFPFVWRLWHVTRSLRPHIMYGSMGISNELSLLVGRAVGAKVVWSLRASNMDFSHYSWLSRWSFRTGAWLSRFPDLIIANAYAGKEHHIAHNYSGKRMMVIPNGIDVEAFQPDLDAGTRVRREWGIREDEMLVGVVGRLDPMKDHATFLRAAARLVRTRRDVRFVCVGGGPERYASELRALVTKLGLEGKVIWAGTRSDMPSVYNALDIACSSSYGEGLPNAIAEAMSCGVPCIVTDVGDSARLLGRPDLVVPPSDPEALAASLNRVLSIPPGERSALGSQARERISREYGVAQLARRTEDALLGLLR